MRSRIFRKFFFATACLIVVSLFAILLIVSYFIIDYLTLEKQNTLYDNCHSIAVVSANNSDINNITVVRDTMHALAASNENIIFAVNEDGVIISCGCEEWFVNQSCVHDNIKVDKLNLKKSMVGHYNEIGDFGGNFKEDYIITGIPLQNKIGVTIGSVYAVYPVSSINTFFSDISYLFFIAAIIPLSILFIVEYVISYKLTKPLKLMSNAAKKMSEGDFSIRIPVRTKDEIGELSKSFNEMSETLGLNEKTRKDFVANVSHELRTPMTNIGGFIDGILDGTIPQKDTHKYLEIVSSEIKRLTRLVGSMFELSKLESGEKQLDLQTFNFTDTLVEILLSKESDISRKNIQIIGIDKIKSIDIIADRDLIHQALYNLVDNAIKFNCDNGFIELDIKSKGNNLIFKISNGGYTINREDLPHIFDRFYKGDKSRSKVKDSTGLGLHLVKTVLEIHNGSISANSILGNRTEFTLTLPIS